MVELMIVIMAIFILAAIAVPSYLQMVYNAQIVTAMAEIRAISNEIAAYVAPGGNFPETLSDVGMDWKLDPWGRPYEYLRIAGRKSKKGASRKDKNLVPLNSDYDLYSCGRDGGSSPPITARESRDDVIRANDGGFIGLAANY